MSKFDQIRLFMLDSDNRPQIDILSINESALKTSIPDSLYAIPGFSMHRRDRKGIKKKGEVLVYINEVKHRRRTDLEDSNIEAVWLEGYPFKSKRPILFAGVYRPPSNSKEKDELLEKNIESAYLLNLETIAIGDINVNYLASSTFKKHCLVRALTSMNFKRLVTQVTRPISKTCLDHVFTNRPERIHSVCVRNSGLADHLPVFAVFKMERFNETQFLATLQEIPWDTSFIFDSVDDILCAWEDLFNKALDNHCPWRGKRVAREKQAPWMTNEVLRHLQKRDSLLKTARVSASLDAWENYKSARNKATNLIKTAKFKFYDNCFENSKGDSKGIWKTIKSLTGTSNKSTKSDGMTADEFNFHFSSIADRLRSLLPRIPFGISKLEHFVLSRKDPDVKFSIPPLTKGFVVDCLRNLNSNKATGVDKFSARVLKIAALVIVSSVTKLMNYSLGSSVFPKRWKTAKVTQSFKAGDRGDPSNYCPISVLPILSKIVERHVHNHLYDYLNDNNLLYARQSDFRRQHGTERLLSSN
ncbi:uncharacterized protein LOC116309015 [Actinia tenebrosa]|uniref:Uncharacterized protein LOC116309015 n=1 Tax=Actinia tenebrosa TaxID=6105 RepID=A0A6P8JCS4_ACTTE|nr:uncharacterized protein LOC116309015 [Actinia tenebrosa]